MRADRTAMLQAARIELAGRERALPRRVEAQEIAPEEAERSLACWRSIVALLEGASPAVPPCLGATPAEAWPHLVLACHAAVEHRAAKNLPAATTLRHLRSLLITSAVHAAAKLPSFDPATIAQDMAA